MDTQNNMENKGANENLESRTFSPEPEQSTSAPTATTPRETEPTQSSMGPVIGAIIIIVILIVGGLYVWGKQLSKEAPVEENAEEVMENDEVTEQIETQSESDEIADIEADLQMNDELFEDLDSDLENL